MPPPPIVIRPDGVWDSRAPFHDFFWGQLRIQRDHNMIALAEAGVRRRLRDVPVTRASFRKLFDAKQDSEAGLAWGRYDRSYEAARRAGKVRPSLADIARDMRSALHRVRETSIIAYAGLFELFVQCWALNVLLARLETGARRALTNAEEEMAMLLSPLHNKGRLPTWPDIVRAFPEVQAGLGALPHVFTDLKTGAPVVVPTEPELNCLRTLIFWRRFRNMVIHADGHVSEAFVAREGAFYERMCRPFVGVGRLAAGRRVKMWDALVMAVGTTHYRAAVWMRDWLIRMSDERRGHLDAPAPFKREGVYLDSYVPGPALLVDGDHEPSFVWAEKKRNRGA